MTNPEVGTLIEGEKVESVAAQSDPKNVEERSPKALINFQNYKFLKATHTMVFVEQVKGILIGK